MQCSPYFRKYFETPCIKLRLFRKCQNNLAILQSYWNFADDYSVTCKLAFFSRLKFLFNFYVKRNVHRQDFGAKFTHTIMALLSWNP